MTQALCRWGILGAAFIARKNWQAIADAGNACLVAVASRDLQRARAFIEQCQQSHPQPRCPEPLESYEALLARQDIDAVYIPLPTATRGPWVLRAIAAGKHVLVEKPVGCNAAEAAQQIEAARRAGLQWMDGVMFMHGRRLAALRTVVDEQVGPVRHIASQFSFRADDEFAQTNIRASGDLEPLGCLGDLGWYCLRFSLWAMQERLPQQAWGRIHRGVRQGSAAEVPLSFTGGLLFEGGVQASFHCCFEAAHAQWATLSGQRGLLRLDDFVLPFHGCETQATLWQSEFEVDGCRANMHAGRQRLVFAEPSNNAPGSQESAMFAHFSRAVLDARIDEAWGEITLRTARVLEACLASAHQDGHRVPLMG
jgi:predicted dehydrogenase